MIIRSLDINKDPFLPQEKDEEVLGDETPYHSAIVALMYLANNTRPDICFAISLLARFNSCPTRRYWKGVKHIFRYLQGTIDMWLWYSNASKSELIGYADASLAICLIHIKPDLKQAIYSPMEVQLCRGFDEANNSYYFFKSCRNNNHSLSQSRVCMVKINDSTHSAIMRCFCANKDSNNIVWR